ncbi:MAG TPA: alkaline phosphatase [Clostridiales bacterium]|nr:alkaline phosphatase [Clostridiales bacterium]
MKPLSKKLIAMLLVLVMTLSLTGMALAEEPAKEAKYVFFFIGDGMGSPQITATRYFLGTLANPDSPFPVPAELSFTTFKSGGLMTTYDSTSFCPDSASTASSMASGEKTLSGVINYDVNKERQFKPVTEYAKEAGKKVGILTSVSLDHATPAAFYAKVPSRSSYYDIAVQGMSGTTLDLIGGGGFRYPTGREKDQKDVFEIAKENGFTFLNDNESIRGLKPEDGERILMIAPDLAGSDAMQYEVDRLRIVEEGGDSLSLADFTKSAINYLDNEEGFFLMVEGGKLDWACHANDAVTTMYETIALSDAVQVAVDFAQEHPDETLIVVTGDHETGGLTIGFATTWYNTYFGYLDNQNISYEDFDKRVTKMREEGLSFEDAMAIVKESYGLTLEEGQDLTLTATETATLKDAYTMSMLPKAQRVIGEKESFMYGGYEPLTVTCAHILNNKSGLAYTSYAHTGLQIPVYAQGVGAENFLGFFDNTDIFFSMMSAMGLIPADSVAAK